MVAKRNPVLVSLLKKNDKIHNIQYKQSLLCIVTLQVMSSCYFPHLKFLFLFLTMEHPQVSQRTKTIPDGEKFFVHCYLFNYRCVCVCVMLLYSSLQCRNNQQLWITLCVFSLVKLRRRRFVVVFISFSCLRWLRAKEDKKVVFTMKMIKIKAGLNTVLDKFKFLESGSISILFKIHKLTYPHTKLTEYLLII